MIDHAVRSMHSGIHEFVLLAKSVTSLHNFSYDFMNKILEMFTTAYCNRLGKCIVGPSNSVVTTISSTLQPSLKKCGLFDRIAFVAKPADLLQILEENQVPTFWGGGANHADIFKDKKLDI